MPRTALLLGSMVVGVALLAPPGLSGGLGLASAQAAPKQQARKKAKGRPAAARPARAAAAPARRVRFSEKKGFPVVARYASLPKFKPRVVLRPTEPHAAGKPAEVAVAPPAPDHRVVAATLPPDRVLATASIAPAPVVHPGAERMRSALEARAQLMAAALGAIAVPMPDAAPVVQLSARSVTFDLARGERTIVFDDGATVTAPFDKARAQDITGLKPASN